MSSLASKIYNYSLGTLHTVKKINIFFSKNKTYSVSMSPFGVFG